MTEAETSTRSTTNTARRASPPHLSSVAKRRARGGSAAETRVIETIMKPVLAWAARRALVGRRHSAQTPAAGRFSRADVHHILRRLWQIYDELAPDLPDEPTLGARMNVRLAAATAAAHRALTETGTDSDEASDLISDIAWVVYEKWGALPRLISRLASRDPVRRMAIATGLFRRFPFGPPGYVMEDVPTDGLVAFDVRRCPVAEYFLSQGLPQVCVAAWCNQDYGLAELWGGRFERGGTLVEGAERCDMRWIPRKHDSRGG